MRQIYYRVECENEDYDEEFKLAEAVSLEDYLEYLRAMKQEYDIYFEVWDEEEQKAVVKVNVTDEF